jgi:hypothetical protein
MRQTHVDLELGVLRRLTSRAQSAASRMTWRRAMQGRSTRTATIIRLLPRIVPGRTVSRAKSDGAWIICTELARSTTPVLVIGTRTPGRTIEDLLAPILVRVRLPDVVDVALLQKLEAQGLVRIVMPEAP